VQGDDFNKMIGNIYNCFSLALRIKTLTKSIKAKCFVAVSSIVIENILIGYCFYYVSTNVLILGGEERLFLYTISVATVHWLISAALTSDKAMSATSLFSKFMPNAIVFTFIESQFIAVIGWILTVFISLVVDGSLSIIIGSSLVANFIVVFIANLFFVFGLWTANLTFRKYIGEASTYILVLLILAEASLAPTFFLFRDIGDTPSVFVTSYNPVSHFLAAYHSILGYGLAPSYHVVPAMGAVGLIVGISLVKIRRHLSDTECAIEDISTHAWRPRPDEWCVFAFAVVLASARLSERSDSETILRVKDMYRLKDDLFVQGFANLIEQPVSILSDHKMELLVATTIRFADRKARSG
jgi:hypothetical protein